MLESDNSELEQVDRAQDTSSFANGTLTCFCDAEYARDGWYATTFTDYGYKVRLAGGSVSADTARLED